MAPIPTPLPSTQLRHAWTLGDVGEYVWVVCALAPSTLSTPSVKTITALCHLHPLVEVDLPSLVDNFHLKMDFLKNKKTFISTLTRSPCLSFHDPLNMVYELLWDWFVPNDFASGFDFFFEICKHIIHGHVLPSVSHLFVALWLLTLDKQTKGVRPIAIGKVIYRLIAYTLAI